MIASRRVQQGELAHQLSAGRGRYFFGFCSGVRLLGFKYCVAPGSKRRAEPETSRSVVVAGFAEERDS